MMSQRGSWNSSPPLISPPLLIILLPIIALTLLFLAVPPLLSAATNILRPASVKTSWDSLNILIVVFAILFGVFARRNDDEQSPPQNTNDVVEHRNDAYIRVSSEGSGTSGYESQHWYGFPEETETKVYDDNALNRLQSPVTGVSPLRRRSSSYPDLRQWTTDDDSYKFRYYDDFEIDKQFRSPAREHFVDVEHRKRWPEERKLEEEVSVKEIPVDTYETRSSPPVNSPAPAPPPPPPPPPLPPQDSARRRPRQMHRNVESVREITEIDDRGFIEVQFPQPDPPTSPPPRPSAKTRSEHRSGKSSERKKSNVKREIAMVWASVLSNQRKRKKKQRTKNDHDHNHQYDNVEVSELTNNTIAPPTPPPPPPPLPPPPSVFHSIFRKGLSKNKKIHSVTTPTPPAPPPPPSLTSSRRWSKRKNQIPPPPPAPPRRQNTGKPPLPSKTSNTFNETVNVNAAGNQSPLIPPPPPPPPFKISAMKFSVRGDFVKIASNQSSQCSSPEREHVDVEVSETTTTPTPVTVTTVNNAVRDNNCHVNGSVFCPSPDVNVKAASFIARLRGEWRLEKLNSIKEKGSLPLARGYSL